MKIKCKGMAKITQRHVRVSTVQYVCISTSSEGTNTICICFHMYTNMYTDMVIYSNKACLYYCASSVFVEQCNFMTTVRPTRNQKSRISEYIRDFEYLVVLIVVTEYVFNTSLLYLISISTITTYLLYIIYSITYTNYCSIEYFCCKTLIW
jgi:hypothetical protein